VPAIIGGVAAVVALFRLASRGIVLLRQRAAGGAGLAATVTTDVELATVPVGPDTGSVLDSEAGTVGSQPGSFGLGGGLEPAETGQRDATQLGGGDPADRPDSGRRSLRTAREFAALGWIWGAILATYLFGFEVGVPVIVAAYCLIAIQWEHRWQRLTYAVLVTALSYGIAYAFITLFSLTFTGILI